MLNAHLSRHFLGFDGTFIAPVDHAFHAGGGDANDNLNIQQTLLAVGGWNEDEQASQLRIYNFMTEYVAKNSVKSASVDLLASLPSRKRLTALASQKTDEGNVLILSGAADGSLKRLRMSVPRMFGGDPSSIRIAEDDLAYDEVNPCTTTYGVPHHGAITSISIHPGGETAATVSIDGRIAISDLTIAGDPVNSTTVHDSDKLSSFSSCQWLTASRVASTSLEGALQIWDVRQLHQKPAIQTLVLPKRIAQCQPLTCLATHPGQPHIVISGDAGGRIVSWDLRSEWEPTCIAYAEANITGLHYSPMSSQLWMTTLTGTIGLVEETTIHTIFKEPVASIMDFCIPESGMLSDLYALNDQESLIFLANAA